MARASHAKSSRVKTEDLVPGSTEVEIYRDSWKGPAALLEIDEDEGAAVVKHQGKPYPTPIRFVRPYKGTFYALDENSGELLYEFMRYVEECQQYKQNYLGSKPFITSEGQQWRTIPEHPHALQARFIRLEHPVHGSLRPGDEDGARSAEYNGHGSHVVQGHERLLTCSEE